MKTWFLRTAVFLGILTSAFLLTCHKKEQEKNIIGEKTKLPETDASLKQVIIVVDTLKFIYTPGASKPTYKPGDILVGQTGEGYLKKVVSTTTSGDTLIVFTEQACLTEAIKRCEIETTFILMPEERQFEKIRQDITFTDEKGRRYWMGIYVKKILVEPHPELAEFTIPLYDVRVEIKDTFGNLVAFFACDTIILTKRIEPDIGITIDSFNLKEFHFIVHDTNKVEFKNCQVGWELSLSKEIEKDLISIPLGKYVIWAPTVPSVPIVFTFALDISAGLEVNAALSVSCEISNNVNLVSGSAIGARYEEGSWSPVNEGGLSGNANFTGNPSVSISVDAEGSLKGKLGCKIYGVAGPYLFLKPYQYNELSYPPFDFRLGIGLGAGLGFKVKILSWVLAEFSYKFLDLKKELIHSTIPPNNPPNTPTTPSGPSSGQPGVSYNFSSSTIDPDGDSVSIRFDWGDGNISNWSSYIPSGQTVTMSHSWQTAGTYYIKAQAKDKNGAISNWSDASQIVMSSGTPLFKIAFYFQENGDSITTLWIINSDGSGLRKLADFNSFSPDIWYPPIFSPDGTQILFIKEYFREIRSEIWKVRIDGTGLTKLTDPGPQRYGHECPRDWSPNGSKIVFRSERSNHNGWFEVWIMNQDGSNQQDLGEANGCAASFSPDGSKIAYNDWYEGNLKVMNADGTNKTIIHHCQRGAAPRNVCWTPQNKIIFEDNPILDNEDIYMINPDGTGLESLVVFPGNDRFHDGDAEYAISPDGSKLVFYSNRNGNYDIYTVNIDGTNLQQLTTDPGDDLEPLFSPDGSKIVWISESSGRKCIWLMNTDGSNKQKLTGDNGDVFKFAVSR